jgi:hypothetical protein
VRSNDDGTTAGDETAVGIGEAMTEGAVALRPTALLPGDVLLYRPIKPNLVQQGIAAATNSPYTHASIFLGDGTVAESMPPLGVRKTDVTKSLGGSYVAVLRSQYGFGEDRTNELLSFVDSVLGKKKFYNLIAATTVPLRQGGQLEFIRKNYGRFTSRDEFAEQSFFCSAFVVACFAVVGIIGPTAQVAYQPDNFAPGHLNLDPTFGWLLGYLVPDGAIVPADDPVLIGGTHWKDIEEDPWWAPPPTA